MFWVFGFYIFTILLVTNPQAQCTVFNVQHRASCITGAPDHLLVGEHQRLGTLEDDNTTTSSESRIVLTPIEIDTWFHIVSSQAAADLVSDEMVNSQVSISK